MMSSTSKVQPLHSAAEEANTPSRCIWADANPSERPAPSLRRIAGAEASNRDDESLPPVGGSIHVVSHPDGYRFAVRARLEVTLKALLDVVETANTFRATVELGLEFEVSEDQWRGCETFWRDHFIPKVPRVFFANADGRENVFACDANEDERVGRDDIGAPLVDSATGELKRLFRIRRLKTVEFHQPLALQKYPFDYQVLAIRCVAEGAEVFGKYYQLELTHPEPSSYCFGCHIIEEDADHVDDLNIECIRPGRPRSREARVRATTAAGIRCPAFRVAAVRFDVIQRDPAGRVYAAAELLHLLGRAL